MLNAVNVIFDLSRTTNTPLAIRMLKCAEEAGELAEAVSHHLGYLPHKQMKEELVGEVADVVATVLDVFRTAYPDLSNEELCQFFTDTLVAKTKKWESVIARD